MSTKIKVKATGYYNSVNKRVCLLREGDILDTISYDNKFDGWKCENPDNGSIVWVEKENSKVVSIVLN
jgi:hypothetical protein